MYTFTEPPPDFGPRNQRCKQLLQTVLAAVRPTRQGIRIRAQQRMFDDPERHGKLYLLVEGVVTHRAGERRVLCHEEGDLVGIEWLTAGDVETPEVYTDFAVVVDEYEAGAFRDAVLESPEARVAWAEYLAEQRAMFLSLVATMTRAGISYVPEPQHHEEGSVMVRQGAEAHEVFTLIEGHADVCVDGVKVGEILPEETFGALAAVAGIPRTADVVASTPCRVLVWPKERFQELIEARPGAVVKLVEELGRNIAALNDRVVKLTAE